MNKPHGVFSYTISKKVNTLSWEHLTFDQDQWTYMRGNQRSVEVTLRQRISWSWAEERNSWSPKGRAEAMYNLIVLTTQAGFQEYGCCSVI